VDEYAKSKKMDEDAAARELADWYAQYGDFSKLKEQGVNTGYLSKVQGAELAGLYNKGKGGTSKTSGEPDYDGLFAAARASGHPQSFIANNYKKYGFSSSTGLYGEYQGDYEYDPGKVSAVAKGLYTDLQKYYASREDQLEKINREYQGGGISEDDYKWLLDKFGLL